MGIYCDSFFAMAREISGLGRAAAGDGVERLNMCVGECVEGCIGCMPPSREIDCIPRLLDDL